MTDNQMQVPPPPQGTPVQPSTIPSPPQGPPVAPMQAIPLQPVQTAPQQMPGQPMQAIPLQAQQPGIPQPGMQHNQRKSVHHSYVWVGSLNLLLALLVVMIFTIGPIMADGLLMEDSMRGIGVSIGVPILIIGVLTIGSSLLYTFLTYKNLSYELGDEEFNLYSGIISKKRIHVPYQRIQSVNQKTSIVQRIVGVCTVTIDTAGGASNKAITVPYIQNTEAERLRHELFARKSAILSGATATAPQSGQAFYAAGAGAGQASGTAAGMPGYPAQATGAQLNVLDEPAAMVTGVRGVFGGQAFDSGVVTYEFGLSNKELLLTSVSNNTGFVLMLITLIASVAGIGSHLLDTSIGSWALESGTHMITDSMSSVIGIGFMALLVVFMFLVFWALSVASTAISFGGFKARRRGTRIEVERGLLQRQLHGVDIDRVQSVIIKQSFIRRLFGFCEVSLGKIDAMADNEEAQQQNLSQGLIVHPFIKRNRVPEVLAGLAPEFAGVPVETKPVAQVALRRAIIRRSILFGGGFWLAVLTTLALLAIKFMVLPSAGADAVFIERIIFPGAIALYVLSVILFALNIVSAVLWYRGSGYAFNRSFMQITNGGFSSMSVSFPRKKIQFGYTNTNPFQRWAKVKTINARTAAGVSGTTMKLIDVQEAEAMEWLAWVRPRTQ